ncbi:MAG: hypothetical protein JRE16_11345 [Deltaproteobacteria bacterium]|jgi:hypothetical protein|nr:hypothetical protein [Deltaproteobacteria bacterium]
MDVQCIKMMIMTPLLVMLAAPFCFAESTHIQPREQIDGNIDIGVGYRGISQHGEPARSREYDSLKASPTFDLDIKNMAGQNDFALEAHYLNDKDYSAEGDFNFQSLLRVHLRNDRFFHNLDHIPYDQDTDSSARPDAFLEENPRVDYEDANPGTDYGIRLDFYETAVRGKLPTYPAHLNLKYWRQEKSGKKQLRYVNENCASACHMRSRNRSIDLTTEEFTASVDAHLGVIDLIFEQVFRTFDNQSATSIDSFDAHWLREQGAYQHDDSPDSDFTQSTIKAHTTLSGGFVANASFSFGERENKSSLNDVAPIRAETDFKKLASDITYSPSEHWTWNFRYRMLELDTSNSGDITATGSQYTDETYSTLFPRSQPFPVRDSIDLDRDFYATSISYRPTHKLSLKLDLKHEQIQRSTTDGPSLHESLTVDPVEIDPYWELPDEENITKVRLSYSSRHLDKNALKFKAWWQYQHSDDPAYNTSVETGHTAFLSATYRPGVLWGTTASLNLQKSRNNDYSRSQFDGSGNVTYFDLDRDQEQQNASVGFWLNPLPGLNLDANYAYLRSRIKQDLLFGNQPPIYTIEDGNVEYRQHVQTLSAGASWQVLETLMCRVQGYHIRSNATYSPQFSVSNLTYDILTGFPPNYDLTALTAGASSAQLRQISKVDIRQNGIQGQVTWQVSDDWSAGIEATFDDYDDLGNNDFDGSVQTYMARLFHTW